MHTEICVIRVFCGFISCAARAGLSWEWGLLRRLCRLAMTGGWLTVAAVQQLAGGFGAVGGEVGLQQGETHKIELGVAAA